MGWFRDGVLEETEEWPELFLVGEQRDWEKRGLWLESRVLEFVIYSWNRSRLYVSKMWSWEEVSKMARR